MSTFIKYTFKIILVLMISNTGFGQNSEHYVPGKERGDPRDEAQGQLQGNRVRTTIFNFAFTGRTGGQFPIDVQTPYEWPKNTGEVYLALTGIFVGGEVVDNTGATQRIIITPHYRNSPDGKSWNLEPLPGYFNKEKQVIATSDDPTTWPSSWPNRLKDVNDPGWKGSWNGFFGKNKFNADEEMYSRASDDRYDRYTDYFPDTTDLTRKGLGIIIDQRAMAWSQFLVQDVVYLINFIRNDGTQDIPKMGVTVWFADFVGGNGDSQDDIADFNLIENILWSRDQDNRAPTFGSDPVGIVALSFLETPGNSTDRIDNDGDGEEGGRKITASMLDGEIPNNFIDDNGNGLVDENETHIPFGTQLGVTFADGIDDNGNAEVGSPVITQEMITVSQNDKWKRWPPFPETDPVQDSIINLILVDQSTLGKAFKNNIDDDGNGEDGSPTITQAMIDLAAKDAPFFRYKVPGTKIILYDLTQKDFGKKYADGIDNDNNGAVDEFMDNGIDEMIDESRDNGIDDDGDWNILTDDVGLDGIPNTGDPGEGDGKPTSGARFGLPGEPDIDVTDVSETDIIGITNTKRIPAGGLNMNSDATMWFDFMIPGKFFDPVQASAGEFDLFASTALFPMKSGQLEPISLAVILANGPFNDPGGNIRKQAILKKRVRAQETYNNDYQFANAPLTPTLTAIPGDNKVTLYWDDIAERSFDAFISKIGGNGNDFEGYRIYRSADPAFEDILDITNGFGIKSFKTPLKIFDLKDGIQGFDSVGIDGVKYYLGNDSGLKHSFVDTTVQNGFTYYYALTSFDFGYAAGDIIPSESPIRISLKAGGSVKLGQNVARVIPEAPSAGYVAPTLSNIQHETGSSTGKISYKILDINKIKNNHVYVLTFEDTLKVGGPGKEDTLTTLNFTLTDSTTNTILINKSENLSETFEQPITDGFRLNFTNAKRVEINLQKSKWNNPNIPHFVFEKLVFPGGIKGEERPNDYEVIFGNVGMDTSLAFNLGSIPFPAKPVNFKVFNNSTQSFINFGFIELDTTNGAGKLSAKGPFKDRIIFLEPNSKDLLVFTWWFYLSAEPDPAAGMTIPQPGDTAKIVLKKPFLSTDKYSFVTKAQSIDNNLARAQLDMIKVVPNPYLASARWEVKNPFKTGRGARSLHFTHLPPKATIRIFTVDGELVKVIRHNSAFNNGTEYWDMLSDDKLSISYGIYLYHIDAPGIGEKIGKFAIIK
ncbi:MAG TPA: hypothetical protein ENI57_04805 [Ignavibacteria bacterium]|nr:hypothetical protein [Ignavibacteria bacterium]